MKRKWTKLARTELATSVQFNSAELHVLCYMHTWKSTSLQTKIYQDQLKFG